MTDKMTAQQAMQEYMENNGIQGGREWQAGFLHGYGEGQALSAPQPAERKPTACVGCEGAPEPVNSPCAVCGQKSTPDVTALVEDISRLRAENEALRVDAERLLAALVAVRAALEYENGKGITDTLWMIPFDYTGTVFDYIDAAIDAARGKYNEQI